jgi:Ca2+-binding EF-hand superfamily protein
MYAIMGMCKGDISKIEKVASNIGCFDLPNVQKLMHVFTKYKSVLFTPISLGNVKEVAIQAIDAATPDALKYNDLFIMFDKDQSGYIDFNEFS